MQGMYIDIGLSITGIDFSKNDFIKIIVFYIPTTKNHKL